MEQAAGNVYLNDLGKKAKAAASYLSTMGVTEKNKGLLASADALTAHADEILSANLLDIQCAKEAGMTEALLDRLALTKERIFDMAAGLTQISGLPDPIGEMTHMEVRPNGLQIGIRRVPLGVVGIIYESRPNVTADAFGLCFKTGNAVILRGGSDAFHSNCAIVRSIRGGLAGIGIPADAVQLLERKDRETASQFMKMKRYLDVLIPRGGALLIRTVVENSTVPVIETGTGNCHIYVDEYADFSMALDIIDNAKTQRLGVCNALESLVVHSKIAASFIPLLFQRLSEKGVEIRGDHRTIEICPDAREAEEEDWGKEYLDSILSLKTVDSIEEAISHINTYNTGHSESIITGNYANAMKFLDEIDAAAVYVNASTRFTDGSEFGFGAEIGISTQKLHARGPMGLLALTTTKYVIFGNGQIRE